jgi:hypothetical protein
MMIVGPVGTVKKPSVVGEAFQATVEIRVLCGFPPRRQFPQASWFFATRFFLCASPLFSTKKFRPRIV